MAQRAERTTNQKINARFDWAQTTSENREHWSMSDGLSIDAAASAGVREIGRNRSRYEYSANGFYSGMVQTAADYIIGIGPRLQSTASGPGLESPKNRKAFNSRLEKDFRAWAKEIGFAQGLRSSCIAEYVSGEGLRVMRFNPSLRSAVKLDIQELECDRLQDQANGYFGLTKTDHENGIVDGIRLGITGRPETYFILPYHPGGLSSGMGSGYQPVEWNARYVLHNFTAVRPEQHRGIPGMSPVLDRFGQIRRYTVAVLGAAETAADFAMVMQTNLVPADGFSGVQPMAEYPLSARMVTALPDGYSLNQTKAEQPTTTFEMFLNSLLREIASVARMPLFFVTLDATQANMSSSYVVTQPFKKAAEVKREAFNVLNDRVLEEWTREWCAVNGFDYEAYDWSHTWGWPRIGHHADPAKTATAQETRLRTGVSSLDVECAEDGNDADEIEAQNAKRFDMTIPEYRKACRDKFFAVASAKPEQKQPDEVPDDELVSASAGGDE